MKAGVSTACLYPQMLEKSLGDLMENGIKNVEIFVNTHSEIKKDFVCSMDDMLKNHDAQCISLHPYTCAIEPMMFFSVYERRVDDIIEYYRRYFEAMKILGAEILVFHGNKSVVRVPDEFYFERFARLVDAGEEFEITVAQENVCRCQCSTLEFQLAMKRYLGDKAKFVLDIKQAVRAGQNPFETVRALGKNVVHIHLSDHGSDGDCLPLGKGNFDISSFLKLLRCIGFDGSVIIELYRHNFENVEELAANYSYLSRLISNSEIQEV